MKKKRVETFSGIRSVGHYVTDNAALGGARSGSPQLVTNEEVLHAQCIYSTYIIPF